MCKSDNMRSPSWLQKSRNWIIGNCFWTALSSHQSSFSLRGKIHSEYGLNRILESRGDGWETNYCPSLQTMFHFGRIVPIGCSWGGKIRCLSQRLSAMSQVNNGFWSLAFCPQFSVSDWTFSNFGLQIKCSEQRREVSARKRGKGKKLIIQPAPHHHY